MKQVLFIVLLAVTLLANAQFTSDIVVYNPTGEPFQLYINNSLVNNYHAKKIVVPELQSGNYQLYIVFQSNAFQPISLIVTLQPGTMLACALIKNQTGQFQLQTSTVLNYLSGANTPYIPPNQPNPPYNPYQPQPQGFCNVPMQTSNFNTAMVTINNRSLESDKLTLAKQIAASNCLTVSQIKQIIKTFSFESSRVDFAKYAYTHCYDPQNYYQINDAFSFSSSITELNEYIKTIK